MTSFPVQLGDAAGRIDDALAALFATAATSQIPDRLAAAMRHAVLGGGKRFRPFLVLESAALFGVSEQHAMTSALALELIHCYSLVHDDLPCMDNDELRRGQPTVWKAFDEWTAVLAGDALQTLAFELASAPSRVTDGAMRRGADGEMRADIVAALARASGAHGMVGGQVLDLEADKLDTGATADLAHIAKLQSMKTARLITVGCEIGAILGRASDSQRAALKHYGECVGFAFQISDDLLDAEGSATVVGKATGKDAAAGKATLVSLVGRERARDHLDETVASAITVMDIFGAKGATLCDAARYMGRRRH